MDEDHSTFSFSLFGRSSFLSGRSLSLSSFSRSLNRLASILLRISVDILKLVGIELGSLQKLHLADENVVDGVDTDAALLDLTGNSLRDELLDKIVEAADGGLTTHDLHHTLADKMDTTGLSVGGQRMALVTDSVVLLGSEGNAEHAHDIAIEGLHINVSLDEGLPLANKGLQTVIGQVHAVEISKAATTIDFVYAELHLPVGKILVALKISKVGLKHTALQSIRSDLKTDGLVDASLANLAVLDAVRSNDIIPLLTKERIVCSLAAKLLTRL